MDFEITSVRLPRPSTDDKSVASPVRDHAVGPLIIRRGLQRKGEKKEGKKKLKPGQTMKSLLTKRGNFFLDKCCLDRESGNCPPQKILVKDDAKLMLAHIHFLMT